MRKRLGLLAFVVLCSLGSLSAAWHARNWGNALSPVDPFSEANAIREVLNFRDTGITANDGLGNVLRPGVYPGQGFQDHSRQFTSSVTPSGVYTHYPPGPEYLLYLDMWLFGSKSILRLRILPLVLTWGAAVFFGLSLRRRFGMPAAALVMLACAALPMFSDADTYLHDIGYAFALLLVEIGVAVGVNSLIWPFAVLGFFQGWLSFDYFFLVTLVPAALELSLGHMGDGHQPRRRLAAYRCVAAGGGFACAHALHFMEVVAYFGSFAAAVHDLSHAAAHRSDVGGLLPRLVLTCLVLKHYLIGDYPISVFFWRPDAGVPGNWHVCRFAGLTMGIWWLILTPLFMAIRSFRKRQSADRHLVRAIDDDWLRVTACGLVPSTLWYVVMLQHSLIHVHYLYRHLFFPFFLAVLFCALELVRSVAPLWQSVAGASLRGKTSVEPVPAAAPVRLPNTIRSPLA